MMQAMPDNRQQSFDEIYGPPENFLEIEVRKMPPLSGYTSSSPATPGGRIAGWWHTTICHACSHAEEES